MELWGWADGGNIGADAVAIESATASPGNQLTWLLPLTIADEYDVYARWGTSNSGATDAKYTVTHEGGTDTVTVDQNLNAGTWFKLGTYDLAPNAGHKVVLSDRANGAVAAEAIRLVSAGSDARRQVGGHGRQRPGPSRSGAAGQRRQATPLLRPTTSLRRAARRASPSTSAPAAGNGIC